jgi:hypothetical protein
VNSEFVSHLQHNWPLAAAAVVAALYLLVSLAGGVVYTNQGRVVRDVEPALYWRWVRRFALLLLACIAVLLGSYWLEVDLWAD